MEPGYEQTAEELINTTVENAESETGVISELNKKKEMLEAGERATIDYYIQETRPIYAGMMVDDFEGNIAGLYDGSAIYVDRSVLMVGESVEQTVAQAEEVYDHESYHKAHKHTGPIHVMAETKDDIALVLGGVEFTETELIEGLTVAKTGDQFVSTEYVEYKNNLLKATVNAAISIDDVEQAVHEKDVTVIDDRMVDPAPEETQALAA